MRIVIPFFVLNLNTQRIIIVIYDLRNRLNLRVAKQLIENK